MKVLSAVAPVALAALMLLSIMLLFVGVVNLVFAVADGDYAAGSVCVALALAGFAAAARARRGRYG